MPSLKRFLAFSLPLGLAAAIFAPALLTGDLSNGAVQAATDTSALESPAELRLAALDTLMKGDKHSAVDMFEEAIRLANLQFGSDSTFLGDLYYETGKLYLELDQFNQAEDYLRQAVKINSKNASARLALARLLDTRAKVPEAIGQIREALMINPNSPVARYKFIQTLSKYGPSPSDKAIVNQESLTLAMMQKASRAAFQPPSQRSAESAAAKPPAKPMSVPSMPKNLVPLKDEVDKAFGKPGEKAPAAAPTPTAASSSATSPGAGTKNSETKNSEPPKAASTEAPADKPAFGGFSLFPLKDMSHRKEQEQRDKEKREAEAKVKAREEAAKQKTESDLVQKLKEQVRQQEKQRAADRAEREELARQARAAKAEAEAARKQASVKPAAASTKAEPKPPKGEASKPAAKPASKPAEQSAPAQQPVQQQPAQQMMPVMPMQPVYMAPPMYQQPVFSPPPKAKPGRGFVPPPPPTMTPMYPGMMQPVMPQVIPAQAKPAPKPTPKPAAPKPAPEAKPAEDKAPPPMTTGGEEEDPKFLMDWAEVKAPQKAKKKAK